MPDRRRLNRHSDGFTLVELMIVVAIIGILAAIAIPAFSRYVKKSRTAEASGHLNKMWAGATAYYIADHADSAGNLVEKQFPGPAAPDESTEQCGCQATQRCPGSSTAWGDPVWTSLSFGVRDPHNYMPHYSATGVGATATFTASATGDLDCDSTLSIFQRNGQIDSNHDVTGSGPVYVYNEVE